MKRGALFAFLGGITTTLIILGLSRARGVTPSVMILAGVAIEQELGLDEFVSILRAHGAFRHGIGGQGT